MDELTPISEEQYIQSQINTLKIFLLETPLEFCIDRLSLVCNIEQLEEKLKKLK